MDKIIHTEKLSPSIGVLPTQNNINPKIIRSESAKPTRLVEGDPFFCIASFCASDLWLYSRVEGKVKWLQQRREKSKPRKLNHRSPLKVTSSSHLQSARFLLRLLPPSSVIQFLHGKK
ncbi:hypothetical protein V6Z11_D04G033700 [Gossypium hirsutum]